MKICLSRHCFVCHKSDEALGLSGLSIKKVTDISGEPMLLSSEDVWLCAVCSENLPCAWCGKPF